MNFPLYHRFSVPSLITLSFKKIFMKKIFRETTFPELYFFFTLVIPEYPVEYLYRTYRKFDLLESDSLLKKEVLKMIFLFCLRSSVPPLIIGTFKNTFHEKHFSWTIFFLKWSFFTLFLKNFFDKFYRTIQKAIFLKINLYNQKNYSENCSSFFSIGTLYSHW